MLVGKLSQEVHDSNASGKRPIPQVLLPSFALAKRLSIVYKETEENHFKVICDVTWKDTKVACWFERSEPILPLCLFILFLFHLVCQWKMALRLGEEKGNEVFQLYLLPRWRFRVFSSFICLSLLWLKSYFEKAK